ncbi:hypothetical protein KA050_03320 [Candidatus Gracilibacteria bacterium]|jgi:hypothetical protein|nr:hypothetical protein [Candidatus Gracilibacteria bacterium]
MKSQKIIKIALYGVLGFAFLCAGILYAKFEKGGLAATIPGPLRSQVIKEEPVVVPKKPTIILSPEKIKLRIEQLEKEILTETNDPDRALELRRELQEMKTQLAENEKQ